MPTTFLILKFMNRSAHDVLFVQKFECQDQVGKSFGYFKSKMFSLGGEFHVFNTSDQQVAEIKGDWKDWNFKFPTKEGREIGSVTKKWTGIDKELFTSADNYMISYMISLTDAPNGNTAAHTLLLAAVWQSTWFLKRRIKHKKARLVCTSLAVS